MGFSRGFEGTPDLVARLPPARISPPRGNGSSAAEELDEAPAQSLNDLAARTHTHQSSVSTIVARLVDQGFVTRTRSSRDGRTIELHLSSRGRKLTARAPNAAQQRLIQGIRELPPTRRRGLASSLAAVARAMDSADGEPAMFFEERAGTRGRRSPRHA